MAEAKDPINGGVDGVESARLRSRIEQTRAEMDETMEELAEQLRPRHLVNEFLGLFRRGENGAKATRLAGRAGHKLIDTVQEHPLGSALIGAGAIYMMFFEDKENAISGDIESMAGAAGCGPSCECGEQAEAASIGQKMSGAAGALKGAASDAAEAVKDQVGNLASKTKEGLASAKDRTAATISGLATSAGEKVQELGHRVGSSVSEAGHAVKEKIGTSMVEAGHAVKCKATDVSQQIRRGYGVSRDRAVEIADEHPLAVGLAVLGLGLLAGLALPRTRREDRLMGEKADELKNRSKELIDRGMHVAQVATEEAIDEAKRQGLTPSTLIDKAKRVVSEARQATTDAVEREEISPDALGEKVKRVAEHASEAARNDLQQADLEDIRI